MGVLCVAHSPTERGDLHFDHLYVCVYFLTALLMGDTTDTGFSLVEFNEALEIVLLVQGLDLFCIQDTAN